MKGMLRALLLIVGIMGLVACNAAPKASVHQKKPVQKHKVAQANKPMTATPSKKKQPYHKVIQKKDSQVLKNKVEVKNLPAIVWVWPAQGKLTRRFSIENTSPESLNKGIDIAGRLGAPVKAAATGKVVYSGHGLVGYGNLIIIKHDKGFLSAYAHNRKLLVHEGDSVKAGQKSAEIGSTGAVAPSLHFEIRYAGRPIDPLAVLPQR